MTKGAMCLMVGDWLRVSDVPTNLESKIGKCGKVAKLEQYHNYSGIAIKFDNELDTYFCEKKEELEPIPLTIEILEKNGIEATDTGCYIGDNLEISVEDNEVWWSINCNEYHIIQLKYVHELQHAIRLCGLDKKIVL